MHRIQNRLIIKLIFLLLSCADNGSVKQDAIQVHPVDKAGNVQGTQLPEENLRFYSYEQATYYYMTHFQKEEVFTHSRSIYKSMYFLDSKRKVFLIFFKNKPTKGYIFEGMSYEEWKKFISSPSVGDFYNLHIKGKKGKGSSPYQFRL